MQMNQPADEEEAGRLGRLLSAVASASAPNFGSWRAAYKLWQLINNRAGPGGSNRPLRGGRVLFSCGDEEWQIVVEGAARTSAQALLACRAERTVSGVSTGDTQQLSAMLGGKLLSRNAWMGGVVIAVMEVGVRVPSAEQCGVLYDARLRDKQRSQHSSMDESIKHGADLWVKVRFSLLVADNSFAQWHSACPCSRQRPRTILQKSTGSGRLAQPSRWRPEHRHAPPGAPEQQRHAAASAAEAIHSRAPDASRAAGRNGVADAVDRTVGRPAVCASPCRRPSDARHARRFASSLWHGLRRLRRRRSFAVDGLQHGLHG